MSLDRETEHRIEDPVPEEVLREARLTPAEAIEAMKITLPVRGNRKLRRVLERANGDAELKAWWHVSNVNAVVRLEINDHSWVHVQIVANIALKLLRQLVRHGVEPSVVTDYGMTSDEAEAVVVLAALMHDVGMSVHRRDHEDWSLFLAQPKLRQLLDGVYDEPERTVVISEMLHAIIAHHGEGRCLTLEAGVLKVADALDMTAGRSRIPFEAGSSGIHAVSAAAIDEVTISKGESRPARIEVRMSNSAGIFQVDELLRRKLEHSTPARLVEVVARIEGESEKRLMPLYTLEATA